MWLARDQNGELFVFYETKPYKDEDIGFWFNEGEWQEVPKYWFPEVKWSDKEPRELTLK